MNKFEIHVLLAGFDASQQAQLDHLLAPMPINVHTAAMTDDVTRYPKVHLLFLGLSALEAEDDKTPSALRFCEGVKVHSPYCIPYMLCNQSIYAEMAGLSGAVFREVIEFFDDQQRLQHRLHCIIDDLNNKFIQLLKKRRLKQLLAERESQVDQLNAQLDKSREHTVETNKQLIRLLSNQVFARMGQRASGRNQQLNLLLHEMCKKCGFNEQQSHDVINAWHLRNIGKMSFDDQLLNIPYIQLNISQQRLFNTHPKLSHAAMMIVRPLDRAAKIVLEHKEYLDGSGYPKGLKGEQISEQAQLLAVINDYTELVSGRYFERAYSTEEAIAYLDQYARERYSDDMVQYLSTLLPRLSKAGKGMHDSRVHSNGLQIGMQLTRDLISKDGILLLSEGLVFDAEAIARVRDMEMNLHENFELFIKKK
ncbi:MAG: HD-GYP domain-containing protein [Pseudomonadales bacterium]